MSDLISRQALLKALDEEVLITVKGANKDTVMRFIRQVNEVIKKQPTVCVIRAENINCPYRIGDKRAHLKLEVENDKD